MIIRNFPNYSITEDGTIISLKTKKEMKVKNNKITLTKDKVRTTFNVSDLVLEHFGISSFKTYVGIDCEIVFTLLDTDQFCICEDQKIIDLKTMEVFIDEKDLTDKTGLKFDKDYSLEFEMVSWDKNIIAMEEFPGYAITSDKKLYDLKKRETKKDNIIGANGVCRHLQLDYLYNKYFK